MSSGQTKGLYEQVFFEDRDVAELERKRRETGNPNYGRLTRVVLRLPEVESPLLRMIRFHINRSGVVMAESDIAGLIRDIESERGQKYVEELVKEFNYQNFSAILSDFFDMVKEQQQESGYTPYVSDLDAAVVGQRPPADKSEAGGPAL